MTDPPFPVTSPTPGPGARGTGGALTLRRARPAAWILLVAWFLPFVAGLPAPLSAQEAGTPESVLPDLRALYAEGFLVEDRNGDGHPDHVAARLLVPDDPGEAEVAAAANLAARLAFESYATELDLLRFDLPGVGVEGRPLVVVGETLNLLEAVAIESSAGQAGLVAGEGAVLRLSSSSALPAGGVWVVGADDTGLLAAADYLAGRYPGVWAPDGPTWEEQVERMVEYLEEAGAMNVRFVLERAVVSASRPGISRASATLHLDDLEGWESAREALTGDLLVSGLHRLDLRLVGPAGEEERLRITHPTPREEGDLPPWAPGEVSDFTLSDLFTLRGIYRDSSEDLLPDRTEAWVSLGGTEASEGAVAIALRISSEATGVRFPLVRLAGEEEPPEDRGFPILFGVDHFTTDRLREEGRLGTLGPAGVTPGPSAPPDTSTAPAAVPAPSTGLGFVELVEMAVEDRPALVVGAVDREGLAAAARLVSHRFPYLHRWQKGAYGLRDVEEEVRRFFQARGSAGQTALALVKLEEWLDRLEAGERPGVPPSNEARPSDPDTPGWRPATPLRGLQVELAVDTVLAGLEEYIRDRVTARFPDVPVGVELLPSAFGAGEEIFREERNFPWEVEEAWGAIRAEILPAVGPGTAGRIEVRVSEPPEIRRELAADLADSVAARGGDPARVEISVLSAYKQGFSWIEEEVVPRLQAGGAAADSPVVRIEIDYHHLQDDEGVRWQVMGSDTRWLQELFPVEEILARELGIPDTAVVFQAVRSPESTYRFRAMDGEGTVLLEEHFSPRWQVNPYFALHPEYERVRVSTGWLHAVLDGVTVADRRIPTDLDRFWSFWQEEIQPAVRDYIMDLHEGEVTPSTAPFLDELRVEVRLSEPNHRIGVDEEVISSLESLHNDLYFTSLAFFSHLGQHYGVGGLNYPGRILPHIDPSGAGEPGWAKVALTGRTRAGPELILRVEGPGSDPGSAAATRSRDLPRWRYALDPLPTEPPKLRGISVQGGESSAGPGGSARGPAEEVIQRLLFEVTAVDSVARYDEHRDAAQEGTVDRTLLSVELLEGMVEAVRRLHGAGLLEEALAFDGVAETAYRFRVERAEDFQRMSILPVSARPASTERPILRAEGFDPGSRLELSPDETGRRPSMVQWDTPIPPPESDSILARLAAFPEAEVYHVGRTFLGKDLWSTDFLPPVEGRYRSRARLTALRPTVFLSGRQHANEVSSTSHLLRLGELLVTDPEYRELLKRVNVVLNPILNADGAQLAYDLQLVNPDFTLHAGYLGALGMDVTSGSGDDPLYPESKVRPAIMEAWLPDAYLNLHGYPSHEWVQHFSAYAAWVRGRTVTQRSWWAPRGWFIPGFTWVDDPDHPEIKEAQFAILDTLAASITSLPEVEAMNRRQYARYARYGRQDVEGFREGFHEGMLVYLSLRGREASGEGPQDPKILTFGATTEAPDETARGEWLELVAGAGLAHTSALIRYMAAGDPRVQRTAEAFRDVVTRTVSRERPVLPVSEDEEEGDAGSEDAPPPP